MVGQSESLLLVSELRFATQELVGLDETVEIFAVDPPSRADEGICAAAPWGTFWSGLLEGNALPRDCSDAVVPEEGGFLLRPIRSGLNRAEHFQSDARRRVTGPPRTCHRDASLPRPTQISNDIFIEIRYSLPPSLLTHFDFADLRAGIFRAFAVPLPDGEVRVLLTPDGLPIDMHACTYICTHTHVHMHAGARPAHARRGCRGDDTHWPRPRLCGSSRALPRRRGR